YIKKDPPKGTGVTCPKCKQGELVQKRTRRGKVFYSCNRYPDCDMAVWSMPLPDPCPHCGGLLTAQARDKAKCVTCGSVVQDGVLVKVVSVPDADGAEGAESTPAAAGSEGNGSGRCATPPARPTRGDACPAWPTRSPPSGAPSPRP